MTMTGNIEFVIPLCGFEKRQLNDLRAILPSKTQVNQGNQQLLKAIFQQWRWTAILQTWFENQLSEVDVTGRKDTYADILSAIEHQDDLRENTLRARLLKLNNESFIETLGERSVDDISYRWAPDDFEDWSILLDMFDQDCFRFLRNDFSRLNVESLDFTYDLWSLFRTSAYTCNLTSNDETIINDVWEADEFTKCYEVRKRERFDVVVFGDYLKDAPAYSRKVTEITPENSAVCRVESRDEIYEIIDLRRRAQRTSWPSDRQKSDEGGYTEEYLSWRIRDEELSTAVADIRSQLHCIPWADLLPLRRDELDQKGFVVLPFENEHDETYHVDWVAWECPNALFQWTHHFYSEEEVFDYCMRVDQPLPGLVDSGKIVFARTRLDETDFVEDLEHFWTDWNDCAITRCPVSSTLYLLETIPGLQYRSRKRQQDTNAAKTYFRNVVEARATETQPVSRLQHFLGTQTYQARFAHSLRLIEADEIRDISSQPIGRGANGEVHSATWRKPNGTLLTSTFQAKDHRVVLKGVRPDIKTDQATKFLHELNTVFHGLSGTIVACVQFLGLTILADQHSERLMLVFERALPGNILDEIQRYNVNADFMSSWENLLGHATSIATGVKTMHSHKVLHRDIHPNNILVALRYFVDADEPQHMAVLSDFGEGKVLDADREIDMGFSGSVGCAEFRAPEIGRTGWTRSADIFSVAIVCCRLLDIRAHFCTASISQSSFTAVDKNDVKILVPTKLRDVLLLCLAQDSARRPSAQQLAKQLDGIYGMLIDRKLTGATEWVTWDWVGARQEAIIYHRSSVASQDLSDLSLFEESI